MFNLDIIPASIGIIQAVIFSVLILSKRPIGSRDLILLFWFLSFSVHLSLILLIDINSRPFILVLAKSMTLLHAPLLFLYTFILFDEYSKKLLVHFGPFLMFLCMGTVIDNTTVLQYFEPALTIAKILSLIGYPLHILFWTNKKLKTIKGRNTESLRLDMRWIKSLALLMIIYVSLGIVHLLVDITFLVEFQSIVDLTVYALMITVLGFLGLRYGRLYTPIAVDNSSNAKPYKNSPLDGNESRQIELQINSYFENTLDFLNSDFNLSQLSEKLRTPKHHLSQVINREMNTTFYDIVNAKRIEFAQQRIRDKSETNISLEGLGYECGFNTKSAFYQHFKNFTGKTPGQFKAEMSPD